MYGAIAINFPFWLGLDFKGARSNGTAKVYFFFFENRASHFEAQMAENGQTGAHLGCAEAISRVQWTGFAGAVN